MLDAHVFCGFVLVRPTARLAWFGEPMPPLVITTSRCIAAAIPDIGWCVSWSDTSDAKRAEYAVEMGLDDEAVARLVRVVEELTNADATDLDLVFDDAGLRRILDVAGSVPDLRVLGLALPVASADAWLAEVGPVVPRGYERRVAELRARRPLPAGGRPLGYEPLCEASMLRPCSWLCNGLVPTLPERFGGVVPNEHGLIDDEAIATELCRIFVEEHLGEPGLWLPWLVVDYTDAYRALPEA